MQNLDYRNGEYRTVPSSPSFFARLFPALSFYSNLLRIVFSASSEAKRGNYGDEEWSQSSLETLRAFESVGGIVRVTGTDNFRSLDGPCVFIGNHMSTLETFVLPVLIQPFKRVTFVVKQSLVEYPVFKYVMRSRDPITVGRTNPREDLKAVLEGGEARLKAGTSLIIFPQTTRSEVFDPAQFNTIGVKLAKRAGVPVVPVALLTNAWGNGKYLKDYGRIDPSKEVRFAFGEPMAVQGRGDEEHAKIIAFITEKLKTWGGRLAEST